MVIKLDYDGDMRRISMTMPEDSDSAQKLKGIRTAVAQGFGIEESALPALRYKDDEGDLCTLVEASVDDLMQLCKSGTMKLFASKSGSPQDPATECEGAGQSKEVQAEKEESSSEQEAAEQKAMLIKAEEEAKKSTMAQLEVLMKQKEAQAIRRLIQERDEADRGMGKEKDAARQKRKMQERSAQEIKRIEQEKANNLARKRNDQVAKWDAKIARKSRALAEEAREWAETKRAEEVRLREAKDRLISELWAAKAEAWLANEEKKNRYEAMDEARELKNDEREKRRARIEKSRWDEDRLREKQEEEEKLERRKTIHLEALRKSKVDAMHRASAAREIQRRSVMREKRINEITEQRMRKFRERQYLEQAKAALQPNFEAERDKDEEEEGNETKEEETTLTKAQLKEKAEFQKTFEFQQRAERRAQRAERIKKEEAKREKLEQLGAKDPTAKEIARIQMWRREDEEKKEWLEKAKLDKELATEQANRQVLETAKKRVDTFTRLEEKRRQRSREREIARNEGARGRIRDAPVGAALPISCPTELQDSEAPACISQRRLFHQGCAVLAS